MFTEESGEVHKHLLTPPNRICDIQGNRVLFDHLNDSSRYEVVGLAILYHLQLCRIGVSLDLHQIP